MQYIEEPSRRVPIVADADVVVCGGGPGGFSAAIAAARHGAKTILIERYGFMGGARHRWSGRSNSGPYGRE